MMSLHGSSAPCDEGTDNLTLGAFIRERRRALGLTQEALAGLISTDGEWLRQADISRIETGRVRLPRTERLARIAAALDLSLGDLLQQAVDVDADGRLVVEPAAPPSPSPAVGLSAPASVPRPIWANPQLCHQLFARVAQAVIVTDPAGVIRYWNAYAERLYGWPAAEAVGRNTMAVTVLEQPAWQEEAGAIMDALRAGQRWSGEFLVRHRDGHPFMAYVSLAPILDQAGQVVAIFGTSHEITRRPQPEAH